MENRRILDVLIPLVKFAEQSEVQIDSEWGLGRSIAEIEAEGDLPAEIANGRKLIKELGG